MISTFKFVTIISYRYCIVYWWWTIFIIIYLNKFSLLVRHEVFSSVFSYVNTLTTDSIFDAILAIFYFYFHDFFFVNLAMNFSIPFFLPFNFKDNHTNFVAQLHNLSGEYDSEKIFDKMFSLKWIRRKWVF